VREHLLVIGIIREVGLEGVVWFHLAQDRDC
jgi:hypothetical protein